MYTCIHVYMYIYLLSYFSPRDQTDFNTDIIPDLAFHQILYVFKSFFHNSFMLPVPRKIICVVSLLS